MSIDFGYIQDYNDRGFGFVSSTLYGSSCSASKKFFFHISKIKRLDRDLAEKLDRMQKVGITYRKISFWYEIETRMGEEQVKEVWFNIQDIPTPKRESLVKHIESLWSNLDKAISHQLDELTSSVLGKAQRDVLKHERAQQERNRREAIEKEQKRREAERQAKLKAAQEAARLAEEKKKQKEIERQAQIEQIINCGSEAEIANFLNSATSAEASGFWSNQNLIKRIVYKEFLWNLAPANIRSVVFKRTYSKFSSEIHKYLHTIRVYEYDNAVKIDASKIYNSLSEKDRTLARCWLNHPLQNEYQLARMLSARAGEKFAFEFYTALEHSVEDIAILQLSGKSTDWQKYDLLLDNTVAIDVKNARRSAASKTQDRYNYSEFCIPRFKKNRGYDVIIAGVFSPYLQLKYIEDLSLAHFTVEPLVFLGEIRNSQIEELEEHFCDKNLLSVKMPRGSCENYIPPWLFDYPERFYTRQIHANSSFKRVEIEESEVPDLVDLHFFDDINCLAIYLGSGRDFPEKWIRHPWQKSFIKKFKLINADRITLPHLFMLILGHFLDMLSVDSENYHPQKYLDLLFQPKSGSNPLGIYDPLNVIQALCETLSTLWDNRLRIHLTEFSYFQFDGRGILKGKKSSADNYSTTILAYCGGTSPNGRCGFSPLILGMHETCETCLRLKCPVCGHCFCSENSTEDKFLSVIESDCPF